MKESHKVEWKESWRDELLKWISGFANAEGGVLHIGRNDKGVVVGLPNAAKLMVEIPNKVRDVLGILVDVDLKEELGKEYVEIRVTPYPYPVSYRGEYHVRSGSTKQELKGATLDKFLLRRQGKHWDGVPIPYVGLDDLEPAALKAFRRQAAKSGRVGTELLAEKDSLLLEKLHLKDGSYLKRAAVLLFHGDPEKYTTGACVKIGFFRTDSDLLYHDVVQGDLFTQADKALDLLMTKYLRAGISYRGLQRIERFPVPEAALREALVNAVVHKDYASATPIQISVYEDKLMLWNPGQLPPDWSLGRLLKKHPSQPANPDIANAFFRAGRIESWGRGIELIRGACVAEGAPKPQFRYDGSGLWVEFPFGAQADTAVGESVTPQVGPESGRSRVGVGPESGRSAVGVEPNAGSLLLYQRILMLLESGSQSSAGLSTALGHSEVSGALRRTVKSLLADGLVAYTLPERPQSRLQRYQLTDAGEVRLREIRERKPTS